ncbi:DUF3224 family protein [Candidatus Bathyarchaeota archaeon]|nr:MAG: DUF3224 family protein [Candidatus Bathyarchaeota archaeon]
MRKMLSALSLMSIVVILSTLSTTVHAATPTAASGYFDYTFEVTGAREADGNLFIDAIEWETWEGDFEGTAVAVFRVGMFSSGFWNVWLRSTFTGTVEGKPGSMVIQLVGKKPEGQDWYGQWVIISGTDELVNLHGHGNWWGPGGGAEGPDIWYEGMIHFD